MPIPLALPLALQGVTALGQLAGGAIQAAGNKRPSLDPLKRNIEDAERIANSAQSRAVYGYDPYTRNSLLERSRGRETALATAAREGGLTPAQIQAARVQGAMSAGSERTGILAQDAQLQEAKQQYADASLRAVADPRMALFGEESSRFAQKAQSANALMGSGLRNLGNIGQDVANISAFQNYRDDMASIRKQMDNPNNNPLTGIGVAANTGPTAGKFGIDYTNAGLSPDMVGGAVEQAMATGVNPMYNNAAQAPFGNSTIPGNDIQWPGMYGQQRTSAVPMVSPAMAGTGSLPAYAGAPQSPAMPLYAPVGGSEFTPLQPSFGQRMASGAENFIMRLFGGQ